ncbi:MAG: hypothetical protein M3P50_04075, partial [Actinomycetota bacterium]|nr:hypothetical protein [Actinomycetota bacterium]
MGGPKAGVVLAGRTLLNINCPAGDVGGV